MDQHRDPSDFTVKEILTEFVLPKIDAIVESQNDDRERISKLEAGKNKMIGALVLMAMGFIPLSVPVVAALLQTKHG